MNLSRPITSASKTGSKIVEALNETIEDIENHLEILSASVSRSHTPAKNLEQENIDYNLFPPPVSNYSFSENVQIKENSTVLSPTPPPLPSEQVDNFCDFTEKVLPPPPTLTIQNFSTLKGSESLKQSLSYETLESDVIFPPQPPERSSSRSRFIRRTSSTSTPPLHR